MAIACRKLISRYLVSTRNDTDCNENNDLCLYLDRQELWSLPWTNENEEILISDLKILKKEKIIIGQCYELYNLLGGDEKKDMDIINNDVAENENKNINVPEDMPNNIIK